MKNLAKRIARNLFTSGDGRRAKRLVMEFGIETLPGSGWGEAAAADHVLKLLERSQKKGGAS